LPLINTNARPIDIANWKGKPEVAECFKNLFENMTEEEGSPLLLTHIIETVLNKDYSKVEMAYVILVCISLLNPNCHKLKLSSNEMKYKINVYLVSCYT
jgi:hypothetical protein